MTSMADTPMLGETFKNFLLSPKPTEKEEEEKKIRYTPLLLD